MILATKAAIAHSGAGFPYLWIVYGAGGTMHTSDSTTVSTWTSVTSSFGASEINEVASNGTNLFVAVGGDGKLATSSNGSTWTQQTSSFSTTFIGCVGYGNGVWVAAGGSGKVATSTDAITWTQQSAVGAGTHRRVVYADGIWVLTSDSGAIYTATDPTSTWTSRTSTMTQTVSGLDYYPSVDLWLAGNDTGTSGAFATSPDGITWTARTSAVSQSSGGISRFGAGDTFAVATYDGTECQSTTNGTTWTSRTLPLSTTNLNRGVAYDNDGTMAVSGCRNDSTDWGVYYTTNGTTFTLGSSFTGASPRKDVIGICHSSGRIGIQ